MCPCAKSLQSCLTLRPRGLQPARLLCPWDFSSKNTGVGCHFLLWRWRGGGGGGGGGGRGCGGEGVFPAPVSPALRVNSLLAEP